MGALRTGGRMGEAHRGRDRAEKGSRARDRARSAGTPGVGGGDVRRRCGVARGRRTTKTARGQKTYHKFDPLVCFLGVI